MHLFDSSLLAATFHIISMTYVFDRGFFLRTGQWVFRPLHPSHNLCVSFSPREVHPPYPKCTFPLVFMMVSKVQWSWRSEPSRIKNRHDLYAFYSRDCQSGDTKGRAELPGNQGWISGRRRDFFVFSRAPIPYPVQCVPVGLKRPQISGWSFAFEWSRGKELVELRLHSSRLLLGMVHLRLAGNLYFFLTFWRLMSTIVVVPHR